MTHPQAPRSSAWRATRRRSWRTGERYLLDGDTVPYVALRPLGPVT
ncbi:hypothetical protein ABH931_003044 [Streptacidiphilus sp. MAP12-33]